MGDIISIGDSLMITVFSMVVVFIVLIGIAYLIDILKVVTNGNKDDKNLNETGIIAEEGLIDKKENIVVEETNDEELVAVIAAAIAASLGVSIPEINIKSIRRISQTNPAWSEAGRREQIFNKL